MMARELMRIVYDPPTRWRGSPVSIHCSTGFIKFCSIVVNKTLHNDMDKISPELVARTNSPKPLELPKTYEQRISVPDGERLTTIEDKKMREALW